MPSFDCVVESQLKHSVRVKQLSAMFDVPLRDSLRHEWKGDLPLEKQPWKVGLIVGPSGSGKTQIAKSVWGELVDRPVAWDSRAVIDNFSSNISMEAISQTCMAVGFNTVPSWMKPFAVLSNGEKFRVELARRLVEAGDLVIVDEFTSVVDRQVAQIGSHAVQKFIRKTSDKQFIGVGCHYDIIDWLQPDWIYDVGANCFQWRCLRQRPELTITISPVPYSAWQMFAPFHYLTNELHRSARCFGLFVGERLAAFAGMLFRVGKHAEPIMGCSRLVTLPDFQGLGLAFVLIDKVAAIYRAVGKRVHTYPAHPALVHAFDRSPVWSLRKRPGEWSNRTSPTGLTESVQGSRPCAVFRYEGEPAEKQQAMQVLSYFSKPQTAKK